MSVYKLRYVFYAFRIRTRDSLAILHRIFAFDPVLCSSFLRHGKKGLSMKMSARAVVFDVAIFDINWDVRLSMQQELGNTRNTLI